MSKFLDKCQEYFNTRDLYEVLNISRNASEKDIKKAYHKLSLQVHPDRVDESEKEEATEKFKVLGRVHSILHDTEKRKIYDDSGEFDDEGDDSSFDWLKYWTREISLKDIENYKNEYIGSDTEKLDVKKAYVGSKGDMNKILTMVPFSNCDDEPRFIEIIRKMVDDGEVEEHDKFFKEPKSRKARRKAKYDAEKREVEQINMDEYVKEVNDRRKSRAKTFMDMITDIEEKYGKPQKRKAISTNGETPPKSRSTRSSKK